MTFIEGLIRFAAGGAIVLAISLIGKYGRADIAGIVALFPVITAISFYFLSLNTEKQLVLTAIKSSLISFPTTIVFLITLYITYNKFNMIKALLISLSAWLISAVIITYARNLFIR